MAAKTRGLGRGLDSLLPGTEEWETSVQEIPIGELDPNPSQPRKSFEEEGIGQLADSIRDQGVLQPLLVVADSNGRYRIVAGERRYRASRMAGLDRVPCIVKKLDEIQQREIALIENLQREDLNPIEAAEGINSLMLQCGYTQEKVSARLGKNRATVANLLRLRTLPEDIKALVRDGKLSAGHARVLAGVESAAEQKTLAEMTVSQELSVRQLEALVAKKKKNPEGKERVKPRLAPELGELQEKILEKTGMKSSLSGTINKGKIVLQYSTRDELERLNEVLDQIR